MKVRLAFVTSGKELNGASHLVYCISPGFLLNCGQTADHHMS